LTFPQTTVGDYGLSVKGFDSSNANGIQSVGLSFDKPFGLGMGKGCPKKDESKKPKIN
jgi:hypothetical protein